MSEEGPVESKKQAGSGSPLQGVWNHEVPAGEVPGDRNTRGKASTNRKHVHRSAIRQRKERDRNRRRNEIVRAATRVFLSRGYLDATMEDIALEAGMSKITIYRYFGSKDSLCYAVLVPVVDALTEHVEAIEKNLLAEKYSGGADLIRDFLDREHRAYRDSPDSFRLIQFFQQSGLVWNLTEELGASLNEKGKHNFRVARRIFQLAVEQGLFKPGDVQVMHDVFYGAHLGIIQISEIKSHRTGVRSEQEAAEAQLLNRLNMLEEMFIQAWVAQ
ncbi:MAG: TetR/AcrR family transcriptional regulator [Proteobacteria bacterium]|nr:TetR/AcrR family transcriptional regulator [Pseudomonadota bacterium]